MELMQGEGLELNCTALVEFNTGVEFHWDYPGQKVITSPHCILQLLLSSATRKNMTCQIQNKLPLSNSFTMVLGCEQKCCGFGVITFCSNKSLLTYANRLIHHPPTLMCLSVATHSVHLSSYYSAISIVQDLISTSALVSFLHLLCTGVMQFMFRSHLAFYVFFA